MLTSLVTVIFVQPRFRELALFPGSFFRHLRHSWVVLYTEDKKKDPGNEVFRQLRQYDVAWRS